MRTRSRSLAAWWALLLGSLPVGAAAAPPPGECPQPRFTGQAPDEYYRRANPLPATPENVNAGERRYLARNACSVCHGRKGDGKGPLASQFDPRPRNFACARTISNVSDGQLFWIIRFGSPGTSMPEHPQFSDEQIWQIVLHLRRLANGR